MNLQPIIIFSRLFWFVFVLIFIGCNSSSNEIPTLIEAEHVSFQKEIAEELSRRAEIDQTAAWIQTGKYEAYSDEEWQSYKDSVFITNKVYLEEILNTHGYPGFDLVGEKGAFNFWLMTQHCDFDIAFQERVLDLMEVEIKKNNADQTNFAYLTDRVRKNKGMKIIYGTQVRYNKQTGQAMSQPLEDSSNVNLRRKEIGLEPLELYLNEMTISHFEMNKANMLKRGIKEPKLYDVPEAKMEEN